jgi:tyrosinase
VGMLSQAGISAADVGRQNQQANGAVPLTAALEARVSSGQLASLKEDVVGQYMKENLRWRILKVRGPSQLFTQRNEY